MSIKDQMACPPPGTWTTATDNALAMLAPLPLRLRLQIGRLLPWLADLGEVVYRAVSDRNPTWVLQCLEPLPLSGTKARRRTVTVGSSCQDALAVAFALDQLRDARRREVEAAAKAPALSKNQARKQLYEFCQSALESLWGMRADHPVERAGKSPYVIEVAETVELARVG